MWAASGAARRADGTGELGGHVGAPLAPGCMCDVCTRSAHARPLQRHNRRPAPCTHATNRLRPLRFTRCGPHVQPDLCKRFGAGAPSALTIRLGVDDSTSLAALYVASARTHLSGHLCWAKRRGLLRGGRKRPEHMCVALRHRQLVPAPARPLHMRRAHLARRRQALRTVTLPAGT